MWIGRRLRSQKILERSNVSSATVK
ncbi:hypothetical protein Golax_000933, partial [Gossypium laxum]|nr:hypothetical protein [Gossypium laxum]